MSQPLVVCCGMGVDSIAMLVGMWMRGIKPDLVIFADVGAERQATYEYIPILRAWLRKVWGIDLVVVRYQPDDFKHYPHYHSLEENLLTNITLASIAYGGHSCSAKWKIAPINQFLSQWEPAIECWAAGGKVRKAIGFEFSPHELRRAKRCNTFAVQKDNTKYFDLWFPLQEWKWNREKCVEMILAAGLPEPSKSSCYFCTAMKPWEVEELPEDKLKRIVIIEARTTQTHLNFAKERSDGWKFVAMMACGGVKYFPFFQQMQWDGVPLTEGIWRQRVKGMRGATPKPGSMTEYIREKGLLPTEEIDRLIAATPTRHLYKGDITSWQDWLNDICYPKRKMAHEEIERILLAA